LAEAASLDIADESPDPAGASRTDAPARGLTNREVDVLQLLVAGQSDKEIAERLFISPRTVQSHVASIFTKLGVNSRTAAATLAVGSGLITDLPTSSA